jgi:osmotically-inducible protein OsmY
VNRPVTRCLGPGAVLALTLAGCGMPVVAWPWPGTPSSARPPLDDRAVTAAVKRALEREPALQGSTIDVRVRDGIASLGGRVPHRMAAERAAVVAAEVRGVHRVVARITQVVPPRSDADLAEELASVLPASVTSDVRRGRAVVEGTVGSDVERDLVERIAKSVPGVKAVSQRLAIDTGPRSDPQIAVDVRRQLQWDPGVDDAYLAVSVVDGVVSLSGGVGSRAERRRAIAAGWVRGAREVDAETLRVHWWLANEWLREDEMPAAVARRPR